MSHYNVWGSSIINQTCQASLAHLSPDVQVYRMFMCILLPCRLAKRCCIRFIRMNYWVQQYSMTNCCIHGLETERSNHPYYGVVGKYWRQRRMDLSPLLFHKISAFIAWTADPVHQFEVTIDESSAWQNFRAQLWLAVKLLIITVSPTKDDRKFTKSLWLTAPQSACF